MQALEGVVFVGWYVLLTNLVATRLLHCTRVPVAMKRCTPAVHKLITALLAPPLQFAPGNRLRQILPRALLYAAILRLVVSGRMRITIQPEVRISFQNDDANPVD